MRETDAEGDVGILDIDPPFIDMVDHDDFVIAVTGSAYNYILE